MEGNGMRNGIEKLRESPDLSFSFLFFPTSPSSFFHFLFLWLKRISFCALVCVYILLHLCEWWVEEEAAAAAAAVRVPVLKSPSSIPKDTYRSESLPVISLCLSLCGITLRRRKRKDHEAQLKKKERKKGSLNFLLLDFAVAIESDSSFGLWSKGVEEHQEGYVM